MQYTCHYQSPLGDILLASDDIGVTGLWFDGQKYYAYNMVPPVEEKETAALIEAKRWLDVYFSGKEPDFQPPIHFVGTPFQCEVWEILQTIPYGRTITYGQIARRLAEKRGLPHFSSQAVGGAVGRNHISLIVPCHRVVGADGSLTGYAGGVKRKVALLELEHTDMDMLYVPKKGTAL